MPGARRTRSLACKNKTKHTSIVTTVTPEITRHSPRNGFTVSFVLSPVIGLVCHRHLRIWRVKTRLGSHTSANLTPASRRQNHTTSPSAESIIRLRTIRQLTGLVDPPCHPLTSPDAAASTASRPASVTIAIRPSVGRNGNGYKSDLGKTRTEIFLQKGLDRKMTDLPVGQISEVSRSKKLRAMC
jgi:hypothetical protein